MTEHQSHTACAESVNAGSKENQIHIKRFGGFDISSVDLRANQRIRLWSVDPRKLQRSRYALAAASPAGQTLFVSGGETESDAASIPRWMPCFCLSKWEEALLRSLGLNAIALPDFDTQSSDLKNRLDHLAGIVESCRMVDGFDPSFGISFREYVSLLCNYRVERKLKYKSSLDEYFFDSPMRCHSECFIANITDEPIVALDVNSMFPDILARALFPDPSRLIYGKPDLKKVLALKNGLFDCILKPRVDIDSKKYDHIPFFAGFDHELIPFKIGNESIRKKLHACEIEAYSSLFDIEVIEGVYSNTPIEHPLAKMASIMFSHKKTNIAAKSVMTTMHASTMRFSTTTAQVELDPSIPISSNVGKYLSLSSDGKSQMYDTKNQTNVYSLTSTVFAHARVRMFKLICAVIDGGFDPVYTNIDSLHVACRHGSGVDDLLALLGDAIGPDMGQLKIEAVADSGIWLSPGVYQLRSAERIVKEANVSLGPHIEQLVFNDITSQVETRHALSLNLVSWQKHLRENRWERCDIQSAMIDTISEMLEFKNRKKAEKLITRFWSVRDLKY